MTRTTLVALLALVPASALAQAPAGRPPMPGGPMGGSGAAPPTTVRTAPAASAPIAPADDASPPAEDDDALGIAPLDASAQGGDETRGVPPPDTYTVRPGDTLWDLSGRFLNNPWYWPKIWSYNPEISNPHWIYPGNLLKFFPAADEGPTRVAPVPGAVAEGPDQGEEEVEGVKELEDFSRADMNAPVDHSDAVAVAGPYKVGYVAPRSRFVRRDTFVTPRELAESGAISSAFEEKLMLSTLDRAYAKFEKPAGVKVGETYVVFKTDRPIYHPITKELFGYQSSVLGSAKVVAVDDRAATLVIGQTLEPIERGAMLGPWTQKLLRPIERKPNRASLDGRIIGAQVDVVTMMGEHHVVFLDKGEKDGVEEGNVLTVVRSGDPYGQNPHAPGWDPRLPRENVGALLVVDVKEKASTALVTRSMSELMVGDRVELRPDSN